METASPEKLNMPKICSFIHAYLSWREKAKLFLNKEQIADMNNMHDYMETLLHHMGVKGANTKLQGNKGMYSVTL